MPDDLHERDSLTWSEHQTGLLRRLARGERVNTIDWTHIVEEIEDVGLSELNAVRSDLRSIMVHLLELARWPGHDSTRHWREEIAGFQVEAIQRFAPSMRQRIDLGPQYSLALRQIKVVDYGSAPPLWPDTCPFTLDMLLTNDVADLERKMSAALSPP